MQQFILVFLSTNELLFLIEEPPWQDVNNTKFVYFNSLPPFIRTY